MPDLTVIDPDTFALFFAASVALGLAPGPDNVFVLTQAALHGPRAGLLVTLGGGASSGGQTLGGRPADGITRLGLAAKAPSAGEDYWANMSGGNKLR